MYLGNIAGGLGDRERGVVMGMVGQLGRGRRKGRGLGE